MHFETITLETHATIFNSLTELKTTKTADTIIHAGMRDGVTPTILIQCGAANEVVLIDDGSYVRFIESA